MVRAETAKCLAKIIQYQHHVPAREELIIFLKENLAQSSNFSLRCTFVSFCKYLITMVSFDFFKKLFLEDLLSLRSDSIERVKIELAETAIIIKPFFDIYPSDAILLTEMLGTLLQDPSTRVSEAAERAEYEILTNRKKNKDLNCEKEEKTKLEFEKALVEREKKELEERKKREEKEEESKYDMHQILGLANKKWRSSK
jgi:hypothetical protein